MDSRLIIPECDIPAQWYHHIEVPGQYNLDELNNMFGFNNEN